MSMAMALQGMTEWLRDHYGWKANECGVQFDCIPPFDAGNFYVGLDDSGVETGPDETDSLKEILTIRIGIWRRPEHLLKDRLGEMKLPFDKYLLGAVTLNELERKVVVHRRAGVLLHGFHNNWSFVSSLNTRYNLPDDTYGAKFLQPLRYRGKGAMESIVMETQSGTMDAWYGYRLRLRGLLREQKQNIATDAIG
jgi:hypothetical protein